MNLFFNFNSIFLLCVSTRVHVGVWVTGVQKGLLVPQELSYKQLWTACRDAGNWTCDGCEGSVQSVGGHSPTARKLAYFIFNFIVLVAVELKEVFLHQLQHCNFSSQVGCSIDGSPAARMLIILIWSIYFFLSSSGPLLSHSRKWRQI